MRYWPRSLFAQMVIVQVAMLLAAAVVVPALMSRLLNSTADEFVSARLAADAREIAASLDPHVSRIVQLRKPHLSPQFDREGGSKAYAIYDGRGAQVLQGERALGSRLPPALTSASRYLQQGNYDILVFPVQLGGQLGSVVVEQDRTAPEVLIDDVVSAFLRRFVWLVPAALVLLFAGGALVSHLAARHIRRNAEAIDQIDAHRLDIRIENDAMPSELSPLIHAANRAFDRLEEGFREQNEFIANVAHELRTPLAVVALRAEAIPDPAVRESIQAGVTRTSHVIGQLMELASVENASPQFERFDLAALAREVVIQHAPLAYREGKSIAFEGGDGQNGAGGTGVGESGLAEIVGNPGLIEIALSNLIDNAIKHTPAGTAILVRLGPGPSVSVIDDGPGIRAADSVLVRQRYWRADHRRSDGAGLGLAIGERVMRLHQGRLDLVDLGTGGAHFRLSFGG